jgi:hypothetical protein
MIDGIWVLSFTTPAGSHSLDLQAASNGDVVTGTLNGKVNQGVRITNGKWDGSRLTFSALLDTPMGPMNMSFSMYAEGDEMAGNISTPHGSFGVAAARKA